LAEILDGRRPRSVVQSWVEMQAVARARPAIAIRAEQRARLCDREVDVEEDGARAFHACR
jgi:hypothetical protein